MENSTFLATLGRTTIAPPRMRRTRPAPDGVPRGLLAAFVLIVRRMIHGALWYGDHPRNILSSRCRPHALGAYPRYRGGRTLAGNTSQRDTAGEEHYAFLLSADKNALRIEEKRDNVITRESWSALYH